MQKIIWMSRHEMTEDQKNDLERVVGDQIEVTVVNYTWQATSSAGNDRAHNRVQWKFLTNRSKIIAGVFPPVAMESIWRKRGVRFYSPVSRQAPELRNGEGPIPFVHLRWSSI